MKREQWTKKLERIVADIEAHKTPAPVRELYVFGSYARGAPECKDLDLVVIHEPPSKKTMDALKKKSDAKARSFFERLVGPQRRFEAQMRRTVQRPGEDMDILLGPDLATALNARSVKETELHLIWSAKDRDWQRKLREITVNANAGPAPRDHFISPKLAQSDEEDVKCVTTLLDDKALALTRVAVESLEVEKLTDDWKQQFDRRRWGKRLQTLLPYAFAWIPSQKVDCIDVREHGVIWDPQRHVRVQLGRLFLYWMFRLFQDQPELRVQCLIPFFRQAYPKELLVFERGPAWQTRSDPWNPGQPNGHA
jgi:predicted nucleotidyltransferase